MQFLLDFLPIGLFFIAYKISGLYTATLVAILASLLHLLYTRYKTGSFQKMPLFSFASISLLGGATLLFQNEIFIKWKPTAIYWLLALFFLCTHYMSEKPLLKRLMEHQLHLSMVAWRRLNLSWFFFFGFLGALNLYVVHHFDTQTWVYFKLFGCLGLTLLFVLIQAVYMARHMHTGTDTGTGGPKP